VQLCLRSSSSVAADRRVANLLRRRRAAGYLPAVLPSAGGCLSDAVAADGFNAAASASSDKVNRRRRRLLAGRVARLSSTRPR